MGGVIADHIFNADMKRTHLQKSTTTAKEKIMESKDKFECGICYYQSLAKDFTPITVSANFAALECPKCLNNDGETFREVNTEEKLAA